MKTTACAALAGAIFAASAAAQTQQDLNRDGTRQFKTGSGLNAQPITVTHKGRQYVTIQSGLGGVNASRMAAQLTGVPRGGSVWTFALMED